MCFLTLQDKPNSLAGVTRSCLRSFHDAHLLRIFAPAFIAESVQRSSGVPHITDVAQTHSSCFSSSAHSCSRAVIFFS